MKKVISVIVLLSIGLVVFQQNSDAKGQDPGSFTASAEEISIHEVESFGNVKMESLVVADDPGTVNKFKKAIDSADKVSGIVNVADPQYMVIIGNESYFLWSREESATIMNTQDRNTVYTVQTEDAVQLHDFFTNLKSEKTDKNNSAYSHAANLVVDETQVMTSLGIYQSRMFAPAPLLAEALHAQLQWNKGGGTTIMQKGDTAISYNRITKETKVNGNPEKLDVKPFWSATESIIDSAELEEIHFPVRFISETLGAAVSWNHDSKTAYVETAPNQALGTKSKYGDLPDEFKENQIHIEVDTRKEVYSLPVEEKEIVIRIENNGSTPISFGEHRHLEKLEQGNWHQLPYDSLAFPDIGLAVQPGGTYEQEMSFNRLNYQLTEGTYRIPKTFSGNQEVFVLAAEFEMK